MKKQDAGGFTLIELMLVVAIIAVLVAIAYPSYRDHLIRSSRTAAQTELLELSSLQEKIYLNTNAYSTSLTAAYTGQSTGGLGRTGALTADSRYTLTLPVATAQSYEINAVPVASTLQAGDGTIAITSTGTRTCAAPVPVWCKNGVW